MSAISEKYNNNSKIEILNKAFSAGCNLAIITTMQTKVLLKITRVINFTNHIILIN